MLYRDHTGGFAESMATTRTVHSEQDIIDHLNKRFGTADYIVEAVKFEFCGYDGRNAWDTYYVSYKRQGEDQWHIIGMSDGNTF